MILQKKLIDKIKKAQNRNHPFQYLTRNFSKEKYNHFKRLHQVDENNKIINTFLDWKTIEIEIIQFNESHYKKVFETKVVTDKMQDKL